MYDYEGEDVDMTASLSTMWQGHDLFPELAEHQHRQSIHNNPARSDTKLPYLMFPCIEKKSVFDEYGESIRPEDYIAVAKTLQPEDSIIQLKKVEEDVMDEEPVEENAY